ncbi:MULTISPECIES: type IA DNA topoisomerase [unclassified Ruminococcus]|uniref:type IA DNA topoisomerase n=1 Tax=unclassified Ruminococcus TaxID=2608920 RepID=UPI00210B6A54|nr:MULTISPECIES: type IA DNA topoisomerase [unclassified Ruminococcus]MCQ4021742.1 DNA topoisomerase III [Ruminococcus sp. zg-924]MCQ4114186.1 DNA topoisomerase III [Ruminococcus sp. zg-921]
MKLVIAEKPSVANTIATVLGLKNEEDRYIICNNGYIVSWCIGHLVGLAMPEAYGSQYAEKPWTFDNLPIIPDVWKLVANSSTKAQFIKLKELMNRVDVSEIICATDAGREGECIFRYVYNLIGCSKPVKRLWTSSLEESAIKRGFNELKADREFDNLFAAGFARARADWLVGMNATRLFSVRYSTPLSIGRVQTPTLSMIVDRNNKVTNFIKEKYYTVELDCGNGLIVSSVEKFELERKSLAEMLKDITNGQQALITLVERKAKTVNPPKLYDLTTLQRDANRIYGFTAQQTLDYTQALYEKKLCTYPRTDSQYITDDMYSTAERMVDAVFRVFQEFAVDTLSPNVQRCVNNSKVSDHHALLTTAEIENYNLSTLPDSELKILRLIALRLICATSAPHIYESTVVELNSTVEKCKSFAFQATGKRIIDNGWKKFEACIKSKNSDKESESKELPQVTEGQIINNVVSSISEHFTSPPKQYTDDTLLSAMETAGNGEYDENSDVEKKGLGTPATRAAILENLVTRGYIVRENKKLIPTNKGIKLISCVPYEVKSPKMTADWEMQLQNIEKGIGTDSDFINAIISFIGELMQKYAFADNSKTFAREWTSVGICPKCGKRVLDYPISYSCESGKNGCGFVIWKTISGKSISAVQAKKLLENSRTDILRGFKSKNGKSFDAALKLTDSYSLEFVFPKRR